MDQIFRMGRYQKQIKRSKNWGFHEGGPANGPNKIPTF